MAPELANKISAGEVVQRPASAVKELVENSIDSGATRIQVIIKDAGKALIQIVDNGEGMAEADVPLAFRRHATSKIYSSTDLDNIRTLGFRGEALASIAAVSQVELKTRREEDDMATLLRIEGDEVKERSKTAFEKGTSIAVRNLFYNTPARRNFLKTGHTELKNITDVVVRYALAYPEIEWLYVSDDETLLSLPKASLDVRAADVFGKKQFESMVSFEEKTELLTAGGFLGKPDFVRKSRAEQYVFLNRRFIFSKMINHAVFHAYEHLLEHGMFPSFILFLTVDPHKVDVNVHPSKMEVKFENESNIYRLVLSIVRKALSAHDLVPTMSFREGTVVDPANGKLRFDSAAPVFSIRRQGPQSGGTIEGTAPIIGLDDILPAPEGRDLLTQDIKFPAAFPAGTQNRLLAHTTVESQEGRAIWQVHNKYIVSQIRSGLMIVDQHVAHERILYERVLSNFENSLPTSQQLLFPETVELSVSDYAMVKELQPHLERLGFDVKLFGKNTVVLEGIPADVRLGNEHKILQDVLDEYKNNEHAGMIDARDNLAKSFACKAAIKAGDKLNVTEMIILIDNLFATKMPYVCPHGRPVVIKIPLEELDKRFGRT
jgi:DNA mismatch repair protein MutL